MNGANWSVIDVSMPTESSSIRILQRLLLQLLDQNVGNMDLYTSLVIAYQQMSSPVDLAEQERVGWQAFETTMSIAANSKNMMVLVDGLESIAGGEIVALEFVGHLSDVAARIPNVTVVVLSRPLSKQSTHNVEHFVITPEHTINDIARMVDKALDSYPLIQNEQPERRQAAVQRIAQSTNGYVLSETYFPMAS